ncbi:MAG: hypothetical protein KGQ36_00140 [Rickettsiales bacterium]|nr:hypothetical protein [Rickettsiales bacterium]
MFASSLIRRFLTIFTIISLIIEQFLFVFSSSAIASDLAITVDGSTDTQVTQTASGIDQINIAAPNSSGLSHNKFTDYNVNSSGQIINNFSGSATAVTGTAIAGLVVANPNLSASGSASVILNEVTSGNTSQLLGYTEIAGTKADLILANPNGIACSGCGFINTAKLLMVAGSSDFDSSGNLGFNLKEQANPNLYVPLITIDGLGLDVENVSGTEIIASSVKLLSSIYGSDDNYVIIKTGEGRYDYDTKEITGDNTKNNTDAVFAIDASALSKIQAGQIYLIATKEGVGVKMEGEILASSTLNIDVNGDIYYNNISASDAATIQSSSSINSLDNDSIISSSTINITANQFNNFGLVSANNLNVENTEILDNSGKFKALNLNLSNINNIDNSGTIYGKNSLVISGKNLTNELLGTIYSPVDYTITLTGLLSNSGLITSGNNLTLNSNQLNNSSEISAQNNLTFSVTNSFENSGSLIATKDLNLTAESLSNSNQIKSDGSSTFNLSSLTNSSSIYSDTVLTLNLASSLNNSGSISSQSDLIITGSSSITNSNQILSNSDINIVGNSFTNDEDAIVSSLVKSLTLTLNETLQNYGDLNAETDLTVSANSLNNSGGIIANSLDITSTNDLTNNGKIGSYNDIKIAAKNLNNSSEIKALTTSTITLTGNLTNFEEALIYSISNLTLSASGYLSNLGEISTRNSADLTFSNITNSNKILANEALNIKSSSIDNNSSDSVLASVNQGVNLNITDFLINSGNIFAKTNLTLGNETELNSIDNSGSITFNKLINTNSELKVRDFINSGEFSSNSAIDDLTITSSNRFTNSGNLFSGKNSTINLSGSFDNSGNLSATNNLTIGSSSSLNNLINSGQIGAVNNLIINSNSDINNSGYILADNIVNISAININNELDAVISSLGAATTLTTSSDVKNYGEISSKTALVLNATNLFNYSNIIAATALNVSGFGLINNSGNLQSSTDTTLTSNSLINSGTIYSKGDSTISSLSDITNSNNIYAEGNLTTTSNNLINQTGAVLSAKENLTANATSDITNSGSIAAVNDLEVTANNFTNSNLVQSGNNSNFTLTSNLTNNSGATIYSGNNIDINKAAGSSLSINNSGSISAVGKSDFTVSSFTNSNSVLANNDVTINADSFNNDNVNSVLASINWALKLNLTKSLANSGTIFAKTDLTLADGVMLDSIDNSGSISFNKLANIDNKIQTKEFINSGIFSSNSSGNNLEITVQDKFDNSGSLFAQGSFTINSNALTSTISKNSGTINSATSLTFNSNNLENSGEISALTNLTIADNSTVTNLGKILANGVVTINAENLENGSEYNSNATISSLTNSLTLTISNQLENFGQLSSSSDLTIAAADVNNSGDVLSSTKLSQTVTNSIINSGTFQSVKDLTLNAASLTNSGVIKSFGNSDETSTNSSNINVAAITNEADALIFSNLSMVIADNISLTNKGTILSNSKLDVTSGDVDNSGSILANSDLDLTVSSSLTNRTSGELSALGNLTIDGTSSKVLNYNQIYSNGNLAITTTELVNEDNGKSKIQSNGTLNLNLTTLTNYEEIIAGKTFTITASGNVSNYSLLQSDEDLILTAASFTNLANSLILAQNDLTIAASTITNSNTKPSDKNSTTSGIISSSGGINLNANSIYNNAGLIKGKSIALNKLSSLSSSLYKKVFDANTMNYSYASDALTFNNTSGKLIADAEVKLDFGNIDYTITGEVTARNIDLTANNINNQGNVVASEFIKLNATGNSGASGSGNITNGFASGDNSNVQLAAGSYIDFVAKNNILNYATISATTNLTLSATNGDIKNYSSGKIIGGNGVATINATNGTFYNYNSTNSSGQVTASSLFISNNNAIFNVKDLSNSGEISVAQDLTANVSNNFSNNSSALIWSGNNIIFNVANSFVNSQAEIYANNNLTIQKNSSTTSSLNKVNSVTNYSGVIKTYLGDLTIKAIDLKNQRSVNLTDSTETNLLVIPEGYTYSYGYCQYCSKFLNTDTQSWTYLGNWRDGNFGGAYHEAYSTTQGSIIQNTTASEIFSGRTLNLEATNITNEASNIFSVSSMFINAQTLSNNSFQYSKDVYYEPINAYGRMQYHYGFSTPQTLLALIKSGSSTPITNLTSLSNVTIAPNVVEGASTQYLTTSSLSTNIGQDTTLGGGSITKSTTVNNIDIYTLAESGVVDVDLSSITNAIGNNNGKKEASKQDVSDSNSGRKVEDAVKEQSVTKGDALNLTSTSSEIDSSSSDDGVDAVDSKTVTKKDVDITTSTITASTSDTIFSGSYKINLDAAATTPLVESRSQFTDVSKFFGSSYYFDQLGLNGSSVLADIDRQTRNTNIRMLGDAFVETTLILNQLQKLTNDSLFLSKTTTDPNEQIKELLDNAVNQFAALGLNAEDVATKGLTASQANSLTKDIVTFELTKVNGVNVLAPKIYLSQSTRNRLLGTDAALATNSTIFAKDNLTIDASTADLLNTGSIIAGNNLTLNIGSLNSSSGGSGNLGTTAINSLAKIKAGNDLTITANNPITTSFDTNSFGIANVIQPLSIPTSGITLQNTYLSSGGKTSLSALGDISIKNDDALKLTTISDIFAASNLSVNSALSSSSRIASKFSASDVLALTSASISSPKDDAAAARAALTFNAGSDIEITSLGNINIANNYTNSGGSIFMSAANNINNSNYTVYASDNVVMDANNINNIHTVGNNSESETRIEAGNIVSLNATKDADGNGGNINNIGATIKAGSLVYLTADNNITNKALVEYNINGAVSYSSGLGISQTANDFTNSTLDDNGVAAADNNLLSAGGNYIRSNLISQGNIIAGDSSTGTVGNVVMVAGNNLNNIGSNITATGDSYLEATNGNINITIALLRDRTVATWGSKKKGGISVSDNTSNIQSNVSAGTLGSGTLDVLAGIDSSSLISSTSEVGNININGSNLSSADDLTLTAQNDVNIISAQDKTYSFSAGRIGKGKSYSNTSSSTTQVASVLSTTNNGDISITSGYNNADTIGADNAKGNLNIIASKLTTEDSDGDSSNNVGFGNITLKARNEVNIKSDFNSLSSERFSSKKGSSVKKTSTEINSSDLNVLSNITANNDVTITSGSDINITASNIIGEGSGTIIAGSYVDTNPLSTTYGQTVTNNDAVVNIFNGKDTIYHYSHITKEKVGVAGGTFGAGVMMVAMAVTAVATGGASLAIMAPMMVSGAGVMAAGVKDTQQSTDAGSTVETVVKSNINFNNNLTIASASDLTVRASNLTTKTGDINLNSGNDINIISDSQTHSSYQHGSTNGLYGSNKKQSAESSNINNISSIIIAGSDNTSINGNLELISVNDTTLKAAKLSANKDVTITSGNDLNFLVATDVALSSYTNNDETTFNFTNGASGNLRTEVINNEIISNTNSITFNTANQNFVEYRSADKTAGMADFEGSLAYLNNLDSSKVIYNPVDEIAEKWNQTGRGLTEIGQGAIAVAAVTVAIASGGIGSGLSGAMMTAAATTAATTVTISATTASMNVDGNLLGSLDDVSKKAIKDTTSDDALKNMIISAAVAGASAWAVQASGGTTSMEKGKDYAVWKPSKELIRDYPEKFANYNGVIDPSVNNIGMANITQDINQVGQPISDFSTNPFTKSFWQGFLKEGGFISDNANKIRGMNSMSTMHDPWGQNFIVEKSPILQITIPPAIAVQYCATFPAACGVVVSGSMNNDFGTKK